MYIHAYTAPKPMDQHNIQEEGEVIFHEEWFFRKGQYPGRKSFSRKSQYAGREAFSRKSQYPGRESFSRKSQYPGREAFSRKSDWSWQRVLPDDDNCKLVENTALAVCKPCPPRHSHNFDAVQWRRWHSSRAVWESRWPSWAVRPNEPSGFRGRKDMLRHWSQLVPSMSSDIRGH